MAKESGGRFEGKGAPEKRESGSTGSTVLSSSDRVAERIRDLFKDLANERRSTERPPQTWTWIADKLLENTGSEEAANRFLAAVEHEMPRRTMDKNKKARKATEL